MSQHGIDALRVFGDELCLRWTTTLIHFLWQGIAVGVVVVVLGRLLRHRSALSRYALHSVALLCLPLVVVMTFVNVDVPRPSRTPVPAREQSSLRSPDNLRGKGETDASLAADTAMSYGRHLVEHPVLVAPEESKDADGADRITDRALVMLRDTLASVPFLLSPAAPWVAVTYLVGAGFFLIRLATAVWGGHRLRTSSMRVEDPQLLKLIVSQSRRVGLKLVPLVAYCERVAVPTVVGALRPVVLLPASFMTGLEPEQFAVIISHELAHIRRYDLLMNLFQRVIESLLFFHPVVWYVSRRMSAERELCCDDLVLSSGYEPLHYAGALLQMAEVCSVARRPELTAVAASGNSRSLFEVRLQRLIDIGTSKPAPLRLTPMGVILCAVLLISGMAMPAVLRSLVHSQGYAAESTKEVNVREVGETINNDPSKQRPPGSTENATQVDRYGDPLPPGAIARLGTVRYRRHSELRMTTGVAFASGSETIIVGSLGQALRFVDARTGELNREMKFGKAYFHSFTVSLDGKTVATLASLQLGETRDVQLALWDVESGGKKSTIHWVEPINDVSTQLAFTPRGSMIATGTSNGKLRFWDVASGDELLSYSVVEGQQITAISFSPVGERVAVASRQGVYLWDWSSGNTPQELEGSTFVVFSRNGKWLATGSEGNIVGGLYNVATKKLVHRLGKANSYFSRGIAFDPNGRWLAIPASTGGVALWDAARGELVKVLPSEHVRIGDVAFSGDGTLLAGITGDLVIRVWELATGQRLDTDFVGHNKGPSEIEFTPDGTKVITGDSTGLVHLWHVNSRKSMHTMHHDGLVAALKVSPDGKYIASAGHDDTVRLLEAATFRQLFKLPGHGRLLAQYKIAFAPDSKTFASFGQDMFVRTWDVRTGRTLTDHAVRPRGMNVQEDDNGNVQVDSAPVRFTEAIRNSLFTTDAKLLLVPDQGELHVFDVQTGKEMRRLRLRWDDTRFEKFSLSPDGNRLVTIAMLPDPAPNEPPTWKSVWRTTDFATNKAIVQRQVDGAHYHVSPRFSPDGRLLGMVLQRGPDQQWWTVIWDMESDKEYARVPAKAQALAFSADNKWFATSSEDTSVLIWNLAQLPRPEK